MTQVVTVHTDFTDLNQMTHGLVGRVNETHVILPASEPVDVGEWVQFAVTLSDGTPGFAGFGRCVTFVDNGEERLAHQRFDVVFDSLQFDPRGQEIYSHILTLGGTDEGQSADAVADDGGFTDVSGDFATRDELAAAEGAPTPGYADGGEEEATMVADGTVHEALARMRVESVVPDDVAEMDDEESAYPASFEADADLALDDPSLGDAEEAMASLDAERRHEQRAQPYLNGGTFAYPDGLPLPDKPPRPALDAAERLTPAPRPRA